MRAFVGSLVAFAILWCVYLASPYWALWRFLAAIEARDRARITERVNTRAVRLSLIKQIATDGLASPSLASALGASGPLTAGAIAAAADPIVERLVTPEGLLGLVPEIGDAGRVTRGGLGSLGFGRLAAFLHGSRWRGFRNVYFALPPGAWVDRRVRAQFRLTRLSWRLVGIEPTAETRAKILSELGRLRQPGG